MTEHDASGTPGTEPEFVAVVPRGPQPPAAPPTPEPEPAPGPQAQGAPDDEPEPVQAEAGEPADEDAGAAEAEQEPDSPVDPLPIPQPADAPAVEEAADAPAPQRSAVPSLDAYATATVPTGVGSALPEPQREPEGGVEVSVRVAAEGMAAALAGLASAGDEEPGPAARPVGRLALATAICVVLALAAGALLAVTARSVSHHRAVSAARAAALDAAKQETKLVLSYNYQTFDRDIAAAEAGMTASFRAGYAQTIEDQVRQLAMHNRASTAATVVAGGVVSATPSTVKVLIFVDQTVQNRLLSATSRLDQLIVEPTMVKQHGRWLINALDTY